MNISARKNDHFSHFYQWRMERFPDSLKIETEIVEMFQFHLGFSDVSMYRCFIQIMIFDKRYFKIKGREQHVPDSCLWTSLEQTDHDESGWIRSFQPTLWLSSELLIHPLSSWSVCSSNVHRCESGRCHSLPFILKYLSFYLFRFSFYIDSDTCDLEGETGEQIFYECLCDSDPARWFSSCEVRLEAQHGREVQQREDGPGESLWCAGSPPETGRSNLSTNQSKFSYTGS